MGFPKVSDMTQFRRYLIRKDGELERKRLICKSPDKDAARKACLKKCHDWCEKIKKKHKGKVLCDCYLKC